VTKETGNVIKKKVMKKTGKMIEEGEMREAGERSADTIGINECRHF
jgi:hypothetical protein